MSTNFIKLALQIAGGALGAQIILFLATPALTRLYNPDAFGYYSSFNSIYVILASLMTLKYEQGIVLHKIEDRAKDNTLLTIFLSAISSVFLIGLILVGYVVWGWSLYWLLMPICTFLAAINAVSYQWCTRRGNYKKYSVAMTLGAIGNVTTALVWGVSFKGSTQGLILGLLSGLMITIFFVNLRVIKLTPLTKCSSMHKKIKTLIVLGRRYKEFPVYILPVSSALMATQVVPPVVIFVSYAAREAGYYAIATKFALLPGLLFGASLGEAFKSELLRKIRNNEACADFVQRSLVKYAILAAPVYMIFAYSLPSLVIYIAGDPYRQAGLYAQLISIAAYGMLIAQPCQYVYIGLNKSKEGVKIQIVASLVPLLVLMISAQSISIELAILFFGMVTLIFSTATLYQTIKILPKEA